MSNDDCGIHSVTAESAKNFLKSIFSFDLLLELILVMLSWI